MSTMQDCSVGIGQEGTFKTPVTPTHWYEFLDETFDDDPTYSDSNGMKTGRVLQRLDRSVLTKEDVSGDLELELFYKGLGFLFNLALGANTSTLVAGSAYQQVITPTPNDYLPSCTIQKGVPPLGGGAASPQTYAGMVCSGFDLTVGNAAIPRVKFSFVGAAMDTSTALTAASYLASNPVWSFVNGSITLGGTVTTPTTTAPASGGTSVADIKEASLTWSNGLDGDGHNLGGAGQLTRKPALGDRKGSGSLTAEFDSTVLLAAWRARTPLALVLNFIGTTPISGSNYPQLQIVCPAILLNGEMPKSNGGAVITQKIPFDIMDNNGVASSDIYVVIVTAETAL